MNYQDSFETPLGKMQITANQHAVTSIHFVDTALKANANAITENAKQQLQEYFAGDRKTFDLPLEATGTDFQKRVWQALTNIDYGETGSYSDIANMINNPKAVRAVGAANGKNPMTIVVPCHRIIGLNGSLTGYASGTKRKAWLLNHESDSLF
jgi:O-6-methylguanine DNA methyltransferase